MRALACLAVAFAVWFLVACSNDLERQSQLQRVRVLAIRADPAEVVLDPDRAIPPAPVRLTALTFAPDGGPTVSYAVCRPGANVYAQGVECPGTDGLTLDGGVVDVNDPPVRDYLATDGGLSLTDPSSQPQLARGILLNIGYLATDGTPGDRGIERGVYQLSVRATRAPNQNPTLAEIFVGRDGGTPLQDAQLPLKTKVTFTPSLAPGSVETYVDANGQTQTEMLVYSWFATGQGKVEDFRSQEPFQGVGKRESDYTTGNAPEVVTLYVVVRDGRGGTDWIIRSFSVGP
ncbi:MAG TPA: hypothetical protein VEM39_04250 [Myxococcaceae bacterium]|nr:hypothetical protein [Myxococcaceae bacterium]